MILIGNFRFCPRFGYYQSKRRLTSFASNIGSAVHLV